MRDIFWGVLLIGIGLVRGDSVFRGDFTILNMIFDALGIFFIIRGVVRIQRAKQAVAPPPPPAAPR